MEIGCTFDLSNKRNKKHIMTTKGTNQTNNYVIYDSMGRRTEIYVIASNIKDACREARKIENKIGSRYYTLKRCYTGGVRG